MAPSRTKKCSCPGCEQCRPTALHRKLQASNAEIKAMLEVATAGFAEGNTAADFQRLVQQRLPLGKSIERSPRELLAWFADLRRLTSNGNLVFWSKRRSPGALEQVTWTAWRVIGPEADRLDPAPRGSTS